VIGITQLRVKRPDLQTAKTGIAKMGRLGIAAACSAGFRKKARKRRAPSVRANP
jgi:hypothetical protein